ncbi:MAG: DUF6465 family protein [Lachnospiraceae bacterium]|nr:DUF6465 family protein [Lachnospiraceae bacterium]
MATTRKTTTAKKTTTAAAKTTAAPAAKVAEEKVETTVKETVKKTTTRKAPAKKAAKVETKVFVEFAGKRVDISDVTTKAVEAYKASHEGAEIKSLEVYVQPENDVAYYAVNGEGSEDFKVALD